jgi:hypothetical protein
MMAIIMPSSPRCLTLICPLFTEAYARQSEPNLLPSLERITAYAGAPTRLIANMERQRWQCDVLQALGLADSPAYASAPVTWSGSGGSAEDGTWLHADPVLHNISSNGLSMTTACWSDVALAQVEALARGHFTSELQWRVVDKRAFLRVEQLIDVQTTAIDHAMHGELQDAQPRGSDGMRLRRAMIELQMLVHEKLSPPAPNAIWLWGSGSIVSVPTKVLPTGWSDDAYVHGIYRMHACDAIKPLASISTILSHSASAQIAVVEATDLASLESQWFKPVLQALESSQIDTVTIYLDGWRVHAERSWWKKIFARTPALTEWLN